MLGVKEVSSGSFAIAIVEIKRLCCRMKLLARRFPGSDWRGTMPSFSWPALRSRLLSPTGAGLLLAVLTMVVLFLMWPYQHWSFQGRLSLLTGWWRFVQENEEWIFCPLVPVASLILAWQRRAELAALPWQGRWSGLVLFTVAMFFYWVGHQADTAYPGFVAAQLGVAAIIISLFGYGWMRVLFFPCLFLVFMWPVFPLEDQVALPLRMMTANWSSKLLNLIGVDNVREGTGLLSAADAAHKLEQGQLFKLDVAAPCSGIRSLYSLMMLAALYGYLFLRGFWPRVLLFLSAMPLAIAGNLVRMVLLALGCIWFGPEVAIGRMIDGHEVVSLYHEIAGYAVFAVALGGMFSLSSLLEGKHWKRWKKKPASGDATLLVGETKPARWQDAVQGLAVAAVGAVTLIFCSGIVPPPSLSAPGVNMQLPLSIASSQGMEFPMTQQERDGLAADITLSRNGYLGPEGQQWIATIVLSGETRRGLHRPDVCLPGQGWAIMDRQEIPIHLPNGQQMSAMMLRVYRDAVEPGTGQLVRQRGINLFWYQGYGGVSTPNYYKHVFDTYFDSIFKRLNHRWALVSFFTQLPETRTDSFDGMTEAKALLDLQNFIGEVAPTILKSAS